MPFNLVAAGLGAVAGALFGGRRRSPSPPPIDPELVAAQKQFLREQTQNLLEMRRIQQENYQRFLSALPIAQSAVTGALRGFGFTETGQPLDFRNLWFFGQMMRQQQRRAAEGVRRLVQMGLSPDDAERLIANAQEEQLMNAIAQGQQMEYDRLLRGAQLAQSLMGMQFDPAVLSALTNATGSMFSSVGNLLTAQREQQVQWQKAQQEYRGTLISALGNVLGQMLGK